MEARGTKRRKIAQVTSSCLSRNAEGALNFFGFKVFRIDAPWDTLRAA